MINLTWEYLWMTRHRLSSCPPSRQCPARRLPLPGGPSRARTAWWRCSHCPTWLSADPSPGRWWSSASNTQSHITPLLVIKAIINERWQIEENETRWRWKWEYLLPCRSRLIRHRGCSSGATVVTWSDWLSGRETSPTQPDLPSSPFTTSRFTSWEIKSWHGEGWS